MHKDDLIRTIEGPKKETIPTVLRDRVSLAMQLYKNFQNFILIEANFWLNLSCPKQKLQRALDTCNFYGLSYFRQLNANGHSVFFEGGIRRISFHLQLFSDKSLIYPLDDAFGALNSILFLG